MDGQPCRARATGLTLLLIGACTLLTLAPIRPAAAEEPSPPEPTVIRADKGSLVLAWQTPSFSVRRARDEDGRVHSVVEAPSWPTSGVPGEPALPYASAVAVVPPTGEVALEVEQSNPRTVPLSLPLKAEPAPQVPEAYRRPGMEAPSWETAARSANQPVTLEELGWLRGHRLVQLTFSPVRYDEERTTLEVAGAVEVRLRFEQPVREASDPGASSAEVTESTPFVSLLEDVVVNPGQVEDFAREDVTASSASSALSQTADSGTRYKVAVTEEGLYELTYEALQDAGLTLGGAPPDGLRLLHAGEEVAYEWEGDSDDAFEAGERILFYARPSSSRWAAHDIYWISTGAAGTLMSSRSGDPTGIELEGTLWTKAEEEKNEGEQNYLSGFRSKRDGDHWYWDRLWREYGIGEGEYDKSFEVALLEPDPAGSESTLTLYLQGTSSFETLDPDHRVRVSLNGHGLGEITWDGERYHTATLTVPTSALEPGLNQVRLTLPGNGATSGMEGMWLDAIEVRYPVAGLLGQTLRLEGEDGRKRYTVGGMSGGKVRVYDVSQPRSPEIVTGATTADGSVTLADADASASEYYLLTGDQIRTPEWIEPAQALPEPSSPPDYLIISHSDFLPALAPLADHRAEDGLMVHTVPVEAVYDVFGDGRVDPQAIRDYVAYAFEQWAPQYLLLVGDGTHDPLNNYRSPDHLPTFVPPYLGMVDSVWGEAPADNRFATLDGPDDQLPELFVGRLPVNTLAEAETVVAKILAYDEAPAPGPWNEPLLFFAGPPDGPTDFHAHSDEIYANALELTSDSQTPERIYYCEEVSGDDCTEPYQISDKERMREIVLSRLNQGALMASWVGHSSWHQWGKDRLLHLDDLPRLRNGGALPLFLQMTCFTSYFSQPTGDTLDESLLRLPDGGAIATWGPASLGLTTGHVTMHKAFVDATLGEPSAQLGPATVAARLALGEAHTSLWNTYALFGDPAMDLNLDVDVWYTIHLPLVARGAAGGD